MYAYIHVNHHFFGCVENDFGFKEDSQSSKVIKKH